MIILNVFAELLFHYNKKWKNDKIDQKYYDWEKGENIRQELGYSHENFKPIPKRKIRNRAARKKHGY